MRIPRILHSLSAVLVLLFVNLAWGAATEQVLYLFNAGEMPGGLVLDNAGNLYGTTYYGGDFNLGSVFELSPSSNGWTRSTLYSFTGGTDGSNPGDFQSLVFDAAGNLYGSTTSGDGGGGTVFKLAPNGGTWTLSVIKHFKAGAPWGTLAFDTAGNLYGTVCCGGDAVFELSPTANGVWTYRILHVFKINTSDGNAPRGAVSFDLSGNLYGTTLWGGGVTTCVNCGTVFKFKPALGGKWSYKVIYRFKGGADGKHPSTGVISDPTGNLYGTTPEGGNTGCTNNGGGGCGTVFKLSPNSNGTYKETRILVFTGSTTDGGAPEGGVIFDQSGNLDGTTSAGGLYSIGTVFQLTPQANRWKETLLYSFNPNVDYGAPSTGMILDPSGNLYGVSGGRSEAYEVTP